MSMKLLSVNIEGQKHLEKIKALIITEKPDVVCMAECFPDTILFLAGDGYPYRLYAPTYMVDQDDEFTLIPSKTRRWGEVIISKYPIFDTQITYLSMDTYSETNLPTHGTDNHIPALITANIEIGGEQYRIGTIHLTWTPKARMTKRQKKNVQELLDLVDQEEIVLCGDFNIPMGNKVYVQMKKRFKDNIPPKIETTLDPKLHYRNTKVPGTLKLVVDYVWSSPKYLVNSVRVISGVSDHCAIACEVVI